MKSAVGKGRPQERRQQEENMAETFTAFLKTMELLGRPYGQNYLVQIVKGRDEFGFWKSPDPRKFETFGALALKNWDFLVLSVHLMVVHELVMTEEPDCTTFQITIKGKDFLKDPYDIYEPVRNLRYNAYEMYLRRRLKALRKARVEETGLPFWEVLPDYTIDRLTVEKPENADTLAEVPGMSQFRVQSIGANVLAEIDESVAGFKELLKERYIELAKTPIYRNAKLAFERNSDIPGVAYDLGCTNSRAIDFAEKLAIAGAINLKSWIEKQVDASTLYRGAEFFLKTKHALLGEAFRTLGIDYDTLKLCRIYSLYVTIETPKAVAV